MRSTPRRIAKRAQEERPGPTAEELDALELRLGRRKPMEPTATNEAETVPEDLQTEETQGKTSPVTASAREQVVMADVRICEEHRAWPVATSTQTLTTNSPTAFASGERHIRYRKLFGTRSTNGAASGGSAAIRLSCTNLPAISGSGLCSTFPVGNTR
jgi:hypothetical protein